MGQYMKIVLISNYRPERAYSMLAYARMLAHGLRARGYDIAVVHPPAIFGRIPGLGGEVAKWLGYIDKFIFAPAWLRWKSRDADIVHVCDHANAMYLRWLGHRPHVITVHDLISVTAARGQYPGIQIRLTGRILQRWVVSSLLRAQNVICDSHQTESELRSVAPRIKAAIAVIHLSLRRDIAPASPPEIERVLARLGLTPGTEYLLHVGGNNWYKNRRGAMEIFAALRKSPQFSSTRLILAGKPLLPELRRFLQSAQLEDWVTEAKDVTDEDLIALYSGAAGLLFPSIVEGFGWPILEAQACGCPVITTNRAPMTEVAGDAAIFIDPARPELAAQLIRDQWSRLPALREAGFRNLERFRPTDVMDAYCRTYEQVAFRKSSRLATGEPRPSLPEKRA
jgi:glycosyltransferase involved in cell wall biosynthesis